MPRPTRRARQIVHFDLDSASPCLAPVDDALGCYVVLWHGDLPVGHIELPLSALPLTGSRLAAAIDGALDVWRPRVGSFMVSRFMVNCPGMSGGPAGPPSCRAGGDRSRLGKPDIGNLGRDLHTRSPGRTRPLSRQSGGSGQPAGRSAGGGQQSGNQGTRAAADAAAAANPWIRYVAEPRPGLDIARNTGVLAAREDIVAFVDDDVRIHPSWLEATAAAFADQGTDAVTGLVLPGHWILRRSICSSGIGGSTRAFGLFATTRPGWRPIPTGERRSGISEQGPAWPSAAICCCASASSMSDWTRGRLAAAGTATNPYPVLAASGTCLYDPSIVAFHTHRRDMPGLRRQLKAYMRGHVTALLIQYERSGHSGNLRRALLGLPLYYLKLLVRGAPTGWSGRYCTLRDEFAGFIDGFRFYLTVPRPRSYDAPASVQAAAGEAGPVGIEPPP